MFPLISSALEGLIWIDNQSSGSRHPKHRCHGWHCSPAGRGQAWWGASLGEAYLGVTGKLQGAVSNIKKGIRHWSYSARLGDGAGNGESIRPWGETQLVRWDRELWNVSGRRRNVSRMRCTPWWSLLLRPIPALIMLPSSQNCRPPER